MRLLFSNCGETSGARVESAAPVTEVGGAASPVGATGATGASQGPIARGSVARVGIATALTAVCGYAVMYLAARDLAPSGFAVLGVFWGATGMVAGAANGLLQETTREVRAARYPDVLPAPAGSHTHPLRVAALVGVVAAVVIAGSSPLWGRCVFVEAPWLSVALLCVGLVGFGLHCTLLGMLAGTDQWTRYGALMVADAAIRAAVATATFVLGWGLAGFLWASRGRRGGLADHAAGLARRTRDTLDLRTPGSTATFLRGAAHSVTAAGASAILVMGFPVLLKATSTELGRTGGVIILAVTLTRAPVLVPADGDAGQPDRSLRRPARATAFGRWSRRSLVLGGHRRGRGAGRGLAGPVAAARRLRPRLPRRRRTAGLAHRGGRGDRAC